MTDKRTLKVSEIINHLQNMLIQHGDLEVSVHVPGDDAGYWDVKDTNQFEIDEYGDSKEKYIKMTIY